MPTETPCPAPLTLQDLLANRLSAATAAEGRQHVAGCPRCQGLLHKSEPGAPAPRHPCMEPPRGEGELGWFGRYRARCVLGEGGMATVFDADDPALGREIALKVMRPDVL